MPGIADVGLDQEKALSLLDGIYSTVVIRDILERENAGGKTDHRPHASAQDHPVPCRQYRLQRIHFLHRQHFDKRRAPFDDGKRKGAPSAHTVQAYVNALLESYFFYEIKR